MQLGPLSAACLDTFRLLCHDDQLFTSLLVAAKVFLSPHSSPEDTSVRQVETSEPPLLRKRNRWQRGEVGCVCVCVCVLCQAESGRAHFLICISFYCTKQAQIRW